MPINAAAQSLSISRELAETHEVQFFVHSRLKATLEDLYRHLPEHKRFLKSLLDKGTLGVAGPFFTPEGKNTGNGFYVLKVENWAVAEAVAARDPFHLRGVRAPEVEAWLQVTAWPDRDLK